MRDWRWRGRRKQTDIQPSIMDLVPKRDGNKERERKAVINERKKRQEKQNDAWVRKHPMSKRTR